MTLKASFLITSTLLATTLLPATVLGSSDFEAPSDQTVDEAAAGSNNAAIVRTKKALLLKRGTADEADLLYVLAELQLRSADLRFRTVHVDANRPGRDVKTDRFESWLGQAISTLDEFLRKFPRDSRVVQATYLRGRASWELGRKDLALLDFKRLSDDFPKSQEAKLALEDLCTLLVEEEKFAEALSYLKRLTLKANDQGYATYLRHRSWVAYQLDDLEEAQAFLLQLLHHLSPMADEDPRKRQYFSSATENLPAFFHAGFKGGRPGFELEKALPTFRRAPRETVGLVMIGFALQLRGSGDAVAMEKYLDQVVREEATRPESLKIATLVFEGLVNSQDNTKVARAAELLVELWRRHPGSAEESVERSLKRVATRLNSLFLKNRETTLGRELAKTLRSIFAALIEFGKNGGKVAEAELRFNQGTLALYLKDYNAAIEDFEKSRTLRESLVGLAEARFELARLAGAIPSQLQAKAGAFIADPDSNVDASGTAIVGGKTSEEVRLLALAVQEAEINGASGTGIERLSFEAARAVYRAAGPVAGVAKLRQFVQRYPGSAHAPIAAALIMDTYVASQEYALAESYSREIQSLRGWKNESVRKQIAVTGGDARLKLAEKAFRAGQYVEALRAARSYLESGATGLPARQASLIAAQSADAVGDWPGAARFYANTIGEGSIRDPLALQARRLRAQLHERRYRYLEAAEDFAEIARIRAGLEESARKKALHFTLISGNVRTAESLLSDSRICSVSNMECERLGILMGLRTQATHERTRAILRLLDGSALGDSANAWKKLDPADQIALLPVLTAKLPTAFRSTGDVLLRKTPVRKQADAVKRRIAALGEIENLSAKLLQIPVASIQSRVLKETSRLYFVTYKEISALGSDSGWNEAAKPLFDKANELDAQALKLAMQRGVEEETLVQLLGPRQSPGLNSEPKRSLASLLETWVQEDLSERKDRTDAFRSALQEAIETRNLQLIAQMAGEGRRLGILKSDTLDVLRALIFDFSGAQAEGIEVLKKSPVRSKAREQERTATLVSIFARLGAKTQVRELLKNSGEESPVLRWAGGTPSRAAQRGRSPASTSEGIVESDPFLAPTGKEVRE